MLDRTITRRRLRGPADVAEIERGRPEDLLPALTILECLRHAAADHPDKPAIVLVEPPDFLVPRRTVTYRQVVTDIERFTGLFLRVAAGRQSVVAVMLPMVPEGLTALWGAATAGKAVPINPFLELDSIASILSQTGATAIVTSRDVLDSKGGAAALRELVPTLRAVFYVDDGDAAHDLSAQAAEAGPGPSLPADPDPWRDAIIMPTGGTTGTPKLVRMSQAAQLEVAWNAGALMGNEPDTVTAHGMPNFHCGGTISLGLRTLIFGGTLLTLTHEGFRNRECVAAFWDICRHYRVTSILATPTTALALLHRGGSSDGCVLRDFHCGGSPLPLDLVQGFHDRFGIWLRDNWGMTEMHGTTTGHFNDGSRPVIGSAGRPLPFVKVKAVHLDEDGHWVGDCAPGERGTLLLSSPTVTRGYVNPDLDDEFFPPGVVVDPLTGHRWGNTGDLGTVDADGYVWVYGRAKDLIIRGGHNIDPKEVEDVLATHPEVHVAAAVGRPDRAKGELPVVYVQLVSGASTSEDELLDFCRGRVAERAAVPVHVTILDEIPLTPVGKISKPRLREMALLEEARRVVATVLGDDARHADVSLDRAAARPCVVVSLERVPDGAIRADDLRAALGGYEFASAVLVASPVG